MGRDTHAKCKKCRRARTKLFLKGDKCYTDKCPMESRAYPPGEAGSRRSRSSQYRVRLREKQKARHIYGLREEQFKIYVDEAKGYKESTGDALIRLLEKRLDNVCYRGGLASSRDQARQLINHGHIEVNGRSVSLPSKLVEPEDTVSVKDNSANKNGIKQILNDNSGRNLPEWLDKDPDGRKLTVLFEPSPEEMKETFEVNLIVEFYSR